MTTDTIARHAAPRSRGKGRTFAVVALLLAAWLGIAGTAYAMFLRTAVGTVNITTTGPGSTALEMFCTAKTTETSNCTYNSTAAFTDGGQTRSVVLLLRNTLAGVQPGDPDTYSKYRLTSQPTVTGPCASYLSFTGPAAALPGGAGVTLRNIASGNDKQLVLNSGPAYNGTNGTTTSDVRTAQKMDPNGGNQYLLELSTAAPPECAQQTVPLSISLELIP